MGFERMLWMTDEDELDSAFAEFPLLFALCRPRRRRLELGDSSSSRSDHGRRVWPVRLWPMCLDSWGVEDAELVSLQVGLWAWKGTHLRSPQVGL